MKYHLLSDTSYLTVIPTVCSPLRVNGLLYPWYASGLKTSRLHSMSKTYEGKMVARYSSQSGPSSFSIQQSLNSQLHLGHHPSE